MSVQCSCGHMNNSETIEEAINEQRCCSECDSELPIFTGTNDILLMLLERIEALEAVNISKADTTPQNDSISGTWVSMKERLPVEAGWYMVQSEYGDNGMSMYYRPKKRSYSDSQWFVNSDTGHNWKGILPERWLQLQEIEE